jgi:hypothetical protein
MHLTFISNMHDIVHNRPARPPPPLRGTSPKYHRKTVVIHEIICIWGRLGGGQAFAILLL